MIVLIDNYDSFTYNLVQYFGEMESDIRVFRNDAITVQGVRDSSGFGAIQNLGVVQEHRRCGLGTSLLLRALTGFRQAGVRRVYLEVSTQNAAALRTLRACEQSWIP